MPSRGNPNVPNKQRKTAGRAKVQKRSATNGISKNPRGTARSSVLHPTSGPLAPLSGKKARKVEKAKNNARRRALEQAMKDEGEVEMTDAPKTIKAKTKSAQEAGDKMEVDAIA
ncbi:hypothetical protein LZ554_006375 [Drepanopeziza brunnea f. sp. 'monogermtubi']|nr:hypothetical protein LZ554_006375 [Drepanopeziza brunnea f. sp. 'monogermtubi']